MKQNSLLLEKSNDNLEGFKIGSLLFLFVEVLLFGGLFITYLLYLFYNKDAFRLASSELSSSYGISNTLLILFVSYFMFKSYKGLKKGSKKHGLGYLIVSLIVASIFISNKLFIWNSKISLGLFPGSEELWKYGAGDSLYYVFYYLFDGLHLLHALVGLVLVGYAILKVEKNSITITNPFVLNIISKYWYTITLIWIFIYLGFYIIA